jgi:hypothetical protein
LIKGELFYAYLKVGYISEVAGITAKISEGSFDLYKDSSKFLNSVGFVIRLETVGLNNSKSLSVKIGPYILKYLCYLILFGI